MVYQLKHDENGAIGGGPDWDIWGCEIGGIPKRLATSTNQQINPDIANDAVIYQQRDNLGNNNYYWQIYSTMFFYSNNAGKRVATRFQNQFDPVVSSNKKAAWYEDRSGTGYNIAYVNNVMADNPFVNYVSTSGSNAYPSICIDTLVWTKNSNVYMKDISSTINPEIPVTTSIASKYMTSVGILNYYGIWVAWTEFDTPNYRVYWRNMLDNEAPYVKSIDPSNNTIINNTSKVITITFSEAVKAGSKWNDIKITKSDGYVVPILSKVFDATKTKLTITRSGTWLNSIYIVLLPKDSIADLAGNGLAKNYTSKFTVDTTD